ncbi:4673_t:CDS:2 [Scutellospora calospora]|uniref:4673_t:CDS:1 n=1 Tax=Scutellospora calospora TaxID=85575 RepID=A0ACA9JU88_9GLOM|nr:4673_t:CDS:2 [Scutellospora calospora]
MAVPLEKTVENANNSGNPGLIGQPEKEERQEDLVFIWHKKLADKENSILS